jgi:hypothetical protein
MIEICSAPHPTNRVTSGMLSADGPVMADHPNTVNELASTSIQHLREEQISIVTGAI